MAIKVRDIPPEGITLELSERLRIPDESAAPTVCSAVLTITPRGEDLLHVGGRVTARPALQCSRCLEVFDFAVDAAVDFELAPAASVRGEPERELDRAELDIEFYAGDEIEPLEILREQVLLAVPMVPVHGAECRGLCTRCGANLNAGDCSCPRNEGGANPFSALKDLFRKP